MRIRRREKLQRLIEAGRELMNHTGHVCQKSSPLDTGHFTTPDRCRQCIIEDQYRHAVEEVQS
jgi:hypothetical protein